MFVRLPEPKQYGPLRIRAARASDFSAMGEQCLYRATAIATDDESGEVVSIGGIFWLPDGRACLFVKNREDLKEKHCVALHIVAKRIIRAVKDAGIKHVVATPDPAMEPQASEWLASLGLKATDNPQIWELV